MSTSSTTPTNPLNSLLTGQTSPQDTIEATTQTAPAKRIKQPVKDKVGFEEFREMRHYNGTPMFLKRCQAWKKHTNQTVQCNGLAVTRRKKVNGDAYNTCEMHGAGRGIGKRKAEGEAARIKSITKHGELTNAVKAKLNKDTQIHRTLVKIGVALEISPHLNRAMPRPVVEDLPALITKLEALENS